MADIDISFHALREELALLIPPVVKETEANAAVLEAFPFNVRPIMASELEKTVLDKSVDRIVFSAAPFACHAGIDDGSFFDSNVDLLVLDIGKLTHAGLVESRLSARLTKDSCALASWRRFVDALRGVTSVGAAAISPRTGAVSQLRTHRFTKGAKDMELRGVAMLPTAGTVRLQLSDIRSSASVSKRSPRS